MIRGRKMATLSVVASVFASTVAFSIVATTLPAHAATAGFVESYSQQPPVGTIPIVGDFTDLDGLHIDDILWYGVGKIREQWWWGTSSGRFTKPTTGNPVINGNYQPLTGDFNGDGHLDIVWYGPGKTVDYVWYGNGLGGFTTSLISPGINGVYQPLIGDFDNNGSDDIIWYAPGRNTDYIWYGWSAPTNPRGDFARAVLPPINGTYDYVTGGDFNGDGALDLLWWSKNSVSHPRWLSTGIRGKWNTDHVSGPGKGSLPMVMNLDGQGASDIFWYGAGTIPDEVMLGTTPVTTAPRHINGNYDPIWGNFNGDTTSPKPFDDILWWATSAGGHDAFWQGNGTASPTPVPYTNHHQDWSTHYPSLGYFNSDNALDIQFGDPFGRSNSFYFGIDTLAGNGPSFGSAVFGSSPIRRHLAPTFAIRGAVCSSAGKKFLPSECALLAHSTR